MRRILGLLLVVGLLVGLVVAPAATAAQAGVGVADDRPPTSLQTESISQSSTGNFTYFTMEGRGYIYGQEELVKDHQGTPYVWESEPLQTRLTLEPRPSTNTKRVCGRILDQNHEAVDTLGCTSWNSSSRRRRATLELPAWPAGAHGTHYLAYEYVEEVPTNESSGNESSAGGSNGGGGQQFERVVHDRYQTEVFVISKQGDLDDDGLSNAREVAEGTDFTRQDTDGDGVSDRAEVFQYGSDPLKADTTGDGIGDGTIASLGLPPTVPYIVHAVVLGGLVAVVAVAVGSLKLWQLLQESGGPGSSPPTQQAPSPPTDPSGPPAGPPGGAAADGAPTSKEEEVFRVIHEHGGQMRQADLVDETEWSKATVSRLLSTLEDEGRVEKIRVGRGNVVRITDGATADANAAGTSQGNG